MYMSRIALNRRLRGAMKLLGNRQAMHAAVMSSFPPDASTGTESGRVLWRVDRHDDAVHLLIVSPTKPSLKHVAEQAGWESAGWETRDYTGFLDSLETNRDYLFRFVGNPTHRVTTESGGKRIVGHVTSEHQRAWFLGKAADHGLSVSATFGDGGGHELILRERDTAVFNRRPGAVTLVTAAFEGRLQITDVERARHALTLGIGRAKGYGCGLLTLMPIG